MAVAERDGGGGRRDGHERAVCTRLLSGLALAIFPLLIHGVLVHACIFGDRAARRSADQRRARRRSDVHAVGQGGRRAVDVARSPGGYGRVLRRRRYGRPVERVLPCPGNGQDRCVLLTGRSCGCWR